MGKVLCIFHFCTSASTQRHREQSTIVAMEKNQQIILILVDGEKFDSERDSISWYSRNDQFFKKNLLFFNKFLSIALPIPHILKVMHIDCQNWAKCDFSEVKKKFSFDEYIVKSVEVCTKTQ